jgi:hypothetical protein
LIKMANETSKIPNRNAISGNVASAASTSALPRRVRFRWDDRIFSRLVLVSDLAAENTSDLKPVEA